MSDDDVGRDDDDAAVTPAVPSGWQLERAISAWQQFQAEVVEDEDLLVDEAVIAAALRRADARDPRALLSALIDAAVWSERRAEEAKSLAAEMTERKRRYDDRVVKLRTLIDQLMAAIPTERAAGRLAKALIVRAPPSTLITDEGQIPDGYFKVERTLRRSDVLADLKDGVVIPGAVLSNGGSTLQLRRLK